MSTGSGAIHSASWNNASARINLGNMYASGQGVSQDYAEAILWYKLVAAQSGPLAHIAQFKLGVIHERGHGVLQNYVLAHMWWNIAAKEGNSLAITYRDKIAEKMSPQQLSEAQKLAIECMARKYNDC